LFIINCKNYEEIAGEKLIKLVKVASKVTKKYKIKIVIAPPIHQISQITKFSVPVLAQHVDTAEAGSTTGFIVPELLKKSKVLGAITIFILYFFATLLATLTSFVSFSPAISS